MWLSQNPIFLNQWVNGIMMWLLYILDCFSWHSTSDVCQVELNLLRLYDVRLTVHLNIRIHLICLLEPIKTPWKNIQGVGTNFEGKNLHSRKISFKILMIKDIKRNKHIFEKLKQYIMPFLRCDSSRIQSHQWHSDVVVIHNFGLFFLTLC